MIGAFETTMSASPAIILTADETMMSQYRGTIFFGFTTCMPRGVFPDWFFFSVFAPPVPRKEGRAVYADSGIRLIESSLLANGFSEDEIAVVHPRDLGKVAGEKTRIVSISGHDFLGINPPTSTFADLIRTGIPLNRAKFLDLMRHPVMKRVTTVVGGKAAWQVAYEPLMDRLGIDHVHLGEGEVSVQKMFRAILAGEEVERIITADDVRLDQIPRLRHATIHGLVEVSRGCVRGCRFCTPRLHLVRHKPLDQILDDVRVNVAAGNRSALLHAEDVFAYGSTGIHPEKEKVIDLFGNVASLPGITSIGLTHLALATIYHHPDLLSDVSGILSSLPDQPFNGVQIGVETGSPRLMGEYMRGKSAPAPPEAWPEIVEQGLGMLHDQNWVSACTLISGLPGEQEEDVLRTLELMDRIRDIRALVVPMNFVSMTPSALSYKESFTTEKMLPVHWQLLAACTEHDLRVVREMLPRITTNNLFMKGLLSTTIWYMSHTAAKYIATMKEGNPPLDLNRKRYLVPEI
jgi:radical SAM superfamily enzyme YgiQ (UPF0313 family)